MQPTAEATTPKQTVSFEEFLEMLDDETHAEWVDGEVIPKMPVSVKHQDNNLNLIFLLALWIKHHQLGRVYHPPLQVRLTLPDGRQVSREPDIVVVLNDRLPQLTKQYFDGAPNIIVEIVSPSRPIDYREKFIEYQSAGVPEYWIIDPEREYAEFWQLDDTGAYRVAYAGSEGVYRSRELPGFWLRVEWIWRQPPPTEIQREWGILPQGV
jgi:Uma2 family endonuclease